jgi:hypothetical protein
VTGAEILAFLSAFTQLAASPEGQAIIALVLLKTNFPVEKVATHADALKPAPAPNERT